MSFINNPETYEFVYLGPKEQKIFYTKDTKMPNTGNFKIVKENHTLGNLLRMELLYNKNIMFVGYKMAHPLKSKIHIRIRTKSNNLSPEKAFLLGITGLKAKITALEASFDEELKQHEWSAKKSGMSKVEKSPFHQGYHSETPKFFKSEK